jgi:hypothetical protein
VVNAFLRAASREGDLEGLVSARHVAIHVIQDEEQLAAIV